MKHSVVRIVQQSRRVDTLLYEFSRYTHDIPRFVIKRETSLIWLKSIFLTGGLFFSFPYIRPHHDNRVRFSSRVFSTMQLPRNYPTSTKLPKGTSTSRGRWQILCKQERIKCIIFAVGALHSRENDEFLEYAPVRFYHLIKYRRWKYF